MGVLIALIVFSLIAFVVWLLVETDKPRKDPYDYLDSARTSIYDTMEAVQKKDLDFMKGGTMIIVRIKETDERLGVKKDEVYVAEAYHMDPSEKCTLLRRLPDMHEPMCNQYWSAVIVLGDFISHKSWEKV